MSVVNQVRFRPVDPEKDVNFILSTWLKSHRTSDFARDIPNDIYYTFHQQLISQILLNPSNNITMVCAPEDPDQLIGYIVYSTTQPIIYYTYVKYNFRKLGLGKHLLGRVRNHFEVELGKKAEAEGKKAQTGLAIYATHKCRRWAKASKKHNLIYNPYIVGE